MTCVMSTLEEISLRPVDSKYVVDGLHTARAELLEEDDATENAQGTLSSSEAGTTKQGTTSWWHVVFTIAAALLANFFLNAGISMIAPFYPIVAQGYSVAVYIVGFVIGVSPLCVTVMSPLVGYFLPHLGLKFTELAGLFLAGGSLILFGFVSMMPSRASFMAFSFLLRITEGIGTAMFATASYTQLTMFYLENKGTIVALLELSLVLGYAAGPAVGGGLADAGGFWLPFVVVGGCILALMLLLGVLLIVVIPPTECSSANVPWRQVLKLFTNIVFILILVSLILAVATPAAAFTYLGKFLHEQFNLSLGIIGVVYLAPTITYAVGTVIVGPITDRLKTPRYLIITGLVIAAVACVLIGPAKFITTPKLWLTIVANVILGAALVIVIIPAYSDMYKTAQAIHVGESATAITSTLSGIYVGSSSAGECLGAVIGGALAYQVGYRSMAAILGLIHLVCALVLVIVTVIQKSVTCLKSNRNNKQ